MPITWLIPLMLASSPLVALDEHGNVATTPLDTWLYHAGPVPEMTWLSAVTGETNPDMVHDELVVAQLSVTREGGFNETGGWQSVTLPHAIDGGISDDPRQYTGWFISEFRVPQTLHGRTVGLWIGDVAAAMRIYVNGQLVGTQGRDTVDDFWPGRRTQPGFRLPPALLRMDRPNTVAVYVHAGLVPTALRDVLLGDASAFPMMSFMLHDAPRMPSVLLTFLLISIALYGLTLYATRRERVEALYFALGCLGASIALFAIGCRVWPFPGVYFLRLSASMVPLVMFFTLFFQRQFNVHYSAGKQRWVSLVLALWFAVTWAMPAALAMTQLKTTIPLVLVAFIYNVFVLMTADQRGVRHARFAMGGMLVLTASSAVQAARFFQGVQDAGGPLSIGLGTFVAVTLMILSRRVTALDIKPAASVEARTKAQLEILTEIGVIAADVDLVSRNVLASVSEGQRGSVGQSSAVAETKAAMQSLLASGRNIMQSAQEVLRGAELTQRNNDQVSERLGELSRHSQRIAEILNVIREVANKSDLLALNAALEGVRAGSSGRGFTLVATQMQQLAETIMRAVSDIRELTVDIREASLSTETSNDEATRLATDTTRSARQISVFIAEQQSGTEQVSRAMEDIAEVAQNSARHGDLTLQRMQDLIRNADRLRNMVRELNERPAP